MLFEAFSHYLSYGATDQQTARSLSGEYDGLLVPGTVAAFQAEGTKGFVLTLSASRKTNYVVDPRSPLFQQQLTQPKKSHEALARVLGLEDMLRLRRAPTVDDYVPALTRELADKWLQFNAGYTEVSSKHFDKYAARLGEAVSPQNASVAEAVLPPYFVASGNDSWWGLSQRLWDLSVEYSVRYGLQERLVRVVASDDANSLADLCLECEEENQVVWVSRLNELDLSRENIEDLRQYGLSIAAASAHGKKLFGLYGGFFSVLLSVFGLAGSSHGIGYGEYRAWEELPQSGPPPARYYLPMAHRYVSQDLADYLWRFRRDLATCFCAECEGENPGNLDYHALMRHSVRCRANEISAWAGLASTEMSDRLVAESTQFEEQLQDFDVPRFLRKQADSSYVHLRPWARVIQEVADEL